MRGENKKYKELKTRQKKRETVREEEEGDMGTEKKE